MFILAAILGILALYALTTGIVLLFAKIEKESDGTPILDTDSWHFKLAYPFGRYEKEFMERLSDGRIKISICTYFWKLFLALWIGWPFLAAVTIVGSAMTCIFGNIIVPSFKDDTKSMEHKEFWLPRIGDFRILPAYFLPLVFYFWLLWSYPSKTWAWTYTAFSWTCAMFKIIIIPAVIFALFVFFLWFLVTDQKEVSLVREMVEAKMNKWCPFFKVKIRTVPVNPDDKHQN